MKKPVTTESRFLSDLRDLYKNHAAADYVRVAFVTDLPDHDARRRFSDREALYVLTRPLTAAVDLLKWQEDYTTTEVGDRVLLARWRPRREVLHAFRDLAFPLMSATDFSRECAADRVKYKWEKEMPGLTAERLLAERDGVNDWTPKTGSRAWWEAPDYTTPTGTRVQVKTPGCRLGDSTQIVTVTRFFGLDEIIG